MADLDKILADQIVLNRSLVQMMYAREQLKEAQRVPSVLNIYTANLAKITSGSALQILTRNPARSGFVVANVGKHPALINGSSFDIAQAKETYNTMAGNSVIPIGVLTGTGGSTSIGTSGPFYACAAGATPTQLLVIETVFTQALTSPNGSDGDAWHRWKQAEQDLGRFIKELV